MSDQTWCRRCRAAGYPFCEHCADVVKRAADYAEVSVEEYAALRYLEDMPTPVLKTGTAVWLEGAPLPSFPT